MKIALVGYGKMGKTIESLLEVSKDQVSHKISSDNASEITSINSRNCDVAIDFSHPAFAFENISTLLENKVKVISGTTAWLDHLPKVIDICNRTKGAFLYASNFSIGVNLFFAITRNASRLFAGQNEYEVDMTEIHHKHKLDAPSGTAISLAEEIIKGDNRYKNWSKGRASSNNHIAIKSIRKDYYPGTHKIRFRSEVDEIELIHQANSRTGFAKGAILAAHWIIDKNGIFSMKDVLNID